jgi:hypothetical protein
MSGCTCTSGIVVFDPAKFALWFPPFAAVPEGQAQGYFYRATNLCDNTACSPITDTNQREYLIYLAMAHLLSLAGLQPGSGTGVPTGLVGRVSSASEGSVSVSTEYSGSGTPGESFWTQTPWGAEWWQATAQFRQMQYYIGPQPYREPYLQAPFRARPW